VQELMETPQTESRFKLFHELMKKKVHRVLLVSTAYEAWIMEEECRLSEHIIHEYRGLYLSRPPRLEWASSTAEALEHLGHKNFDLVIIITDRVGRDAYRIGGRIKQKDPGMPVVLLTHQETLPDTDPVPEGLAEAIDDTFFWAGQADILLAIIKSVEDRFNADNDTRCAGIRVILFVEDSPYYRSSLLPILYKELVTETQFVIDDGLNEEHRLLCMRARPKILLADCFENALALYERFKPYVLGVISDVRFPRAGRPDAGAGIALLQYIRHDRFDIPLLLASSEPHNAELAATIPAVFIDKNAAGLHDQIRSFLMDYLGFGDFVFRSPDGRPIDKATDIYTLEQKLRVIPDDTFVFHCNRNDFSRWFFSMAEVELAARVRPVRDSDFHSVSQHRRHLIRMIKDQRMRRQKGVIVNFDRDRFDPDTEFLKIGKGSLGGKARGLAYMAAMLHRERSLRETFGDVDIIVPQTVVVTTDHFDDFVRLNQLGSVIAEELPDEVIARRFRQGDFPDELKSQLEAFLENVREPLAVRSSSVLEDARFKAYAGLYKTYMLANDHPDLGCRLAQLLDAIKMVYASTYFSQPRAFSRRVGNRIESEKMAVVIQKVIGSRYGNHFYPSLAGIAQSLNYYPFARMQPQDGIANIALGLGRYVMEGKQNLRFSPRMPDVQPERATVDAILKNAQQHFYALKMGEEACRLGVDDAVTLAWREVADCMGEYPVQLLTSSYDPEEGRLRDAPARAGYPVVTFAALLKHKIFPLAEILTTLLALGQERLGCPVEMEFAVDFGPGPHPTARLAVLQIRPMSAREDMLAVEIADDERDRAFCVSHQALGNTVNRTMCDIVYVVPEKFDPAETVAVAGEIARINAGLAASGKKYILIGPGRWGSADRWLGIPVAWGDICGVGTIIEATHPSINAEPSQGSHFFHNITTLGIPYLHVGVSDADRLDWDWIRSLDAVQRDTHIVHAVAPAPLTMKIDGRQRLGILLKPVSN